MKSSVRHFIDSLVIAFVIAMIIRAFLFSTYKVPTGSMLNTIQLGDFLIGNKAAYLIKDPKFNDIAIFEYPLEPKLDFIKRVIGVPGDEIEIINKTVYRNGTAIEEPYKVITFKKDSKADYVEKFTVPDGMYFMMGDNRDYSYDGRFWGLVPRDAFKAKAAVIYFSMEPGKGLSGIRWNRILNFLK